jgi:hypothetical protein
MSNETSLTVADLTDEHIGWYMKIDVKPNPDAIFQHFNKHIELGAIRRWEYPEGTPRTGLLDLSTKAPGIAGTEHVGFAEDAKVELVRQFKKPRKARKK